MMGRRKNNINFSFNRNFCRSIGYCSNQSGDSFYPGTVPYHIRDSTMVADILCSFLWRLSYYWRKALGSVRKKKVFYLGHLLLCCLHWEPDYPQVLKCWRYSVHCRAGCCIYNAISCINCNEHLLAEQERNRAMAILVLLQQ